jgi:long-chain acyl-CoA synthetase
VEPTGETVYMFSYTSGTTGNPKAVQLTQAMNIAVCTSVSMTGVNITDADTHMSFLPFAHSME